MCRSCADGGRRCPLTDDSREAGKAAATRYYRRGKARLLIAQLSDHGIRAMDDTSMPPTYHVARSGKDLDLDDGREVGLSTIARPDKPTGALWTAPGRIDKDGAVKSAWTDYDAQEGGSKRPAKEMHVVRTQPGAVVVSIDSPEDAQALMDRYETRDTAGSRSFDWVAMKRDGIDGVYASPDAVQGNLNHKDQAFANFYGWDASSVAWLSNDNISVDEGKAQGGTYTVTYPDTEDDDHQERPDISDEGMGEYVTPKHPDLNGAWDRVPKKVRESKVAEGGLPPSTGTREDSPSRAKDVKTPKGKEYTEGAPRDPDSLLDAGREGIEFLRGFMEKKQESRDAS